MKYRLNRWLILGLVISFSLSSYAQDSITQTAERFSREFFDVLKSGDQEKFRGFFAQKDDLIIYLKQSGRPFSDSMVEKKRVRIDKETPLIYNSLTQSIVKLGKEWKGVKFEGITINHPEKTLYGFPRIDIRISLSADDVKFILAIDECFYIDNKWVIKDNPSIRLNNE